MTPFEVYRKEMSSLLLHLLCTALLLLNLSTAQNSSSKVEFHVGVVLDLTSPDSPVGRIGMSCLSIAHSDFYSLHQDYKTRLVFHVLDSNNSIIDAAAAALDLLQEVKVDAIIGPQKSTQVDFVVALGERARVPIISFSATSPSLVPRSPYFVQTAQSDANQVEAIASIVGAFKWVQVVIIYEDTEFGNGIVPSLANALQDIHARVSYRCVLPKSASDDFISKELYKMMTMQTRVFVVHTSESLGKRLFLKSSELGMMIDGYAWIVTSGLTDLFNLVDSGVVEAMQGVLGVRPLIPRSKELESFASRWFQKFLHEAKEDMTMKPPVEVSVFGLWAYDTLWALAMAAERVGHNGSHVTKNGADMVRSGPFAVEISKTGPRILEALLDTKFRGLAGEYFSLVNRQLEQTSYEIVNVVGRNVRPVGTWTPSSGISKNLKSIIWPGDSTKPPRGWEVPVKGKKLRIGVPQKPGFNEFLKVEIDAKTNKTIVSGYYKEVFDAVIENLPYSVPYKYVAYPFFYRNGSRAGNYDDLVYEVSLQENYDGALGDITITATRSSFADFTLPYAEGGVASIVPVKYEDVNDIWTFLEPLTIELWLATAVFYISTGLVIWILANRTNAGAPGQHAGMVCYFPFFPGEGIEANLLCLILVTWAFVASLLNSTYTASLSSRITVARLQPMVTDVSKLIKNGDFVGCQEGSFLVGFLMKLGFNEAKIRTFESADACHEDLSKGSKNGGISAYYDVMPHIKHLLSRHSGKYMIVGPIHRTDGFAFAFPKGSPLIADISRSIIQLTEDGRIHEILQRVTIDTECSGSETSSSPTSVTLRSFLVLFAITGCVTLTCLLVSLLRHLHRKRSFRLRISDFNSNVGYIILSLRENFKRIILSLRENFKRNDTSSLPRIADIQEMKSMEVN